jgi:branched-subunit amino acid aminotransferase/4-amino-4-deoxychorismate lyase
MAQAQFLFLDGKIIPTNKCFISPDNRSFRYGDGFFETMKWNKGQLVLEQFHMERLFLSLNTLKFTPPRFFTPLYITSAIKELITKNKHHDLARIRVIVFRGDGGLYDPQNHSPHILIQTWELNPSNNELNENGLNIGVFKEAVKAADFFSSIKSNSCLPYVMAALWVKEQKLNDVLLLNANGFIADATIANVFIITNGIIQTPPISDGPVAGVMRKYLLEKLRLNQYEVQETSLTPQAIANASEVFLTNAIYGMKWVKQFQENEYSLQLIPTIYRNFILPLYK